MTADSYMYPNGTHTFWLTSPFPIQCTWVLVTDHAYMYIQCRLTLDSLAHSPFPIPHSPYSVHTHTCDRPCLHVHVHVYTMQVDSRLTSPFLVHSCDVEVGGAVGVGADQDACFRKVQTQQLDALLQGASLATPKRAQHQGGDLYRLTTCTCTCTCRRCVHVCRLPK